MTAQQRIDPLGRCPTFLQADSCSRSRRARRTGRLASERITVPGPKTRDATEVAVTTTRAQEVYASSQAYGFGDNGRLLA